MSTAAERIVSKLNAHRVREGEFRARCPVHGGRSMNSMSIKDAGGCVLIYCHARCELKDILAALGMSSPRELFDSVRTKPDPAAGRRALALQGLEIWCERQLVHVCEILRELDYNIGLSAAALAAFEDGRRPRDPKEEEEVWSRLARGYKMRSDFEYEFEILNGRDTQAKLDLWRRHR